MRDLCVGQTVFWRYVCSNYGHVQYVPGVITRIGKRVTIEVEKISGEKKRVVVRPENISAHSKPFGQGLSS